MDKNEKAGVTVRIYESTLQKINRRKGNSPIGLFIDNAIEHYCKYLDNEKLIDKLEHDIEHIKSNQKISLGLLCEVLKQAGILDSGGEIKLN